MKNLRLFKNNEELSDAEDSLSRPNVSYVEDGGIVHYYPNYPESIIVKINQQTWDSNNTTEDVVGISIDNDLSIISITNGKMIFEKEYKYQNGDLKLTNMGWDDEDSFCLFFLSNSPSLVYDGVSMSFSTAVPMIPKEIKEYCKVNKISIDITGLTQENTNKILSNCNWQLLNSNEYLLSGIEIGTSASKKFPYTIEQSDYKYLYLCFI